MPEKERQFFTIDQAIEAVRIAFDQYASQMNLLSTLWPMVFGEETYILKDNHSRRVWAKISGTAKPILSSEDDLKQRIVDQLIRLPPSPAHLARICSLVFGAPVRVDTGPEPDLTPGIWVDTDMAGFICTQCGHCCRTLNYHDGCSVSDYRRWQELGRTDILDWVDTTLQNGRVIACRIWMLPGSNQFAQTCPWLKKLPDQGRYICTIYDVRPAICRQYPGSRKHARMTGCGGI
jgi:Fe-S-cluster containining protein